MTGHPTSEQTKRKISESLKNYWTEEKRKTHSEKRKGIIRSEESREKTSRTLKQKYAQNIIIPYFKGKPGTMLGKNLTQEQRQKVSDHHWSKNPETSEKIKKLLSEKAHARKDKKRSEDTKFKISQSALNRPKSKFLTPSGDIVYMQKAAAMSNHKDWKLLE